MLPTIGKSTSVNSDLMNVIYVLNRWKKMLINYGQLDPTTINKDFSLISKVIRETNIKRAIKDAISQCRDCALAGENAIDRFLSSIKFALKVLCDSQEDKSIKRVKKYYADQGMAERYRHLSKRLAREKIRKIDKGIAYTDSDTDDSKITKLIRRIVEKRAAQDVFRNAGMDVHGSNRFRQSVRRATSFSLYNSSFAEYDQSKRINGTHWKVVERKGCVKLKSKKSYSTYDEATEACIQYALEHPDDPRPMSAYKCEHCGKWHIGHERISNDGPAEMSAVS